MTQLFTNNASTTLLSQCQASDTSITLAPGSGSLFPMPANQGDYFLATIELNGVREIVKCVGRIGDTLNVTRGWENTIAQAFPAGTLLDSRITAGTLQALQALSNGLDINNIASQSYALSTSVAMAIVLGS